MSNGNIQFIDLKAQRSRISEQIDRAISNVLEHGNYIMGPEIRELEKLLSEYTGVSNVITCSSGTDALLLPMMAENISPGDVVFVPAFTFVAAAEISMLLKAVPYFVDVLPDTFNMNPESLKQAITSAKKDGYKARAVVVVDLYGQTADYDRIQQIADENNLILIEDFAQSFGATLNGKFAGNFGDVASTSFFPAKPLGCYGDGGAIFTNNDDLAEKIRTFRVHGQGNRKYQYSEVGINGRLDTIQAAILIEKLSIFPDEVEKRQALADRYSEELSNCSTVPYVPENMTSVWGQYTLKISNREEFISAMKEEGIPVAVHYPLPLTEQPAYRECPVVPDGIPVSIRHASQVVSLPMHPYLDEHTQDRIITSVKKHASPA